jgi:hypothetical protein
MAVGLTTACSRCIDRDLAFRMLKHRVRRCGGGYCIQEPRTDAHIHPPPPVPSTHFWAPKPRAKFVNAAFEPPKIKPVTKASRAEAKQTKRKEKEKKKKRESLPDIVPPEEEADAPPLVRWWACLSGCVGRLQERCLASV